MSMVTVAAVRDLVISGIDAEQQDRLAAGQPLLTGQDQQRLAISLARAHVGELRRRQINQGEQLPEPGADELLIASVLDALFRLGPLERLAADQGIYEINFNGVDCWVKAMDGGKRRIDPAPFAAEPELVAWVQAQGMYCGVSSRAWDAANPIVELPLPGGHRLVGIREAGTRVYVSIRLLRLPNVTLSQLRGKDDFDECVQAFLEALVAARMNVVISGATGSAKTTLLRALTRLIGPHERIVVVEHFPELGIDRDSAAHPDVVPLQERTANAEGAGAITMTALVRTSRRMDPDRIIVGECVGEEVIDLLDALSQGNDGGFTTIHAKSARAVPSRIATYAHRQGLAISAALALTAQAVDFIVHMSTVRYPDGREGRKITSIVEVTGFDANAGQVQMSEVFAYTPGDATARPAAAVTPGRSAALAAVGWSAQAQHLDAAALAMSGGQVPGSVMGGVW